MSAVDEAPARSPADGEASAAIEPRRRGRLIVSDGAARHLIQGVAERGPLRTRDVDVHIDHLDDDGVSARLEFAAEYPESALSVALERFRQHVGRGGEATARAAAASTRRRRLRPRRGHRTGSSGPMSRRPEAHRPGDAVMPILRRLLALLVAVALVAAGIFLIVEVVAAWFGSDPVLLSETATTTWRTTAWDDDAVIWTAVIVGVVGAALPDRRAVARHTDDRAEPARRRRARATLPRTGAANASCKPSTASPTPTSKSADPEPPPGSTPTACSTPRRSKRPAKSDSPTPLNASPSPPTPASRCEPSGSAREA